MSVVKECSVCHAKLGQHDVGDGASVFLIFLLGASIIPMAWAFECLVAPPLWVHVVLWGTVALGIRHVLCAPLRLMRYVEKGEQEALDRVIGYFELLAEEQGISLRKTLPGSSGVEGLVRADETMLIRAVSNLVSNALRHAPGGRSEA